MSVYAKAHEIYEEDDQCLRDFKRSTKVTVPEFGDLIWDTPGRLNW